MTAFPRIFIASLALGSAASAAQYPYQYPYPQGQYPQNYPYGYPNQPGGIGGAIIDQLLGRYQVNDRQAIRQCANAAVRQAQNQYRGYGQYGTPGVPYGYDQQYAQPQFESYRQLGYLAARAMCHHAGEPAEALAARFEAIQLWFESQTWEPATVLEGMEELRAELSR